MKKCEDCGEELAETGAPIWEDYCPNQKCSGPTKKQELFALVRTAQEAEEREEYARLAAKYGGTTSRPAKGRLAELESNATPGVWGQFNPTVGPFQKEAAEAWNLNNFKVLDTSHHMSAVQEGKPQRLAEFQCAADAAFAEALVNAYRDGRLVEA